MKYSPEELKELKHQLKHRLLESRHGGVVDDIFDAIDWLVNENVELRLSHTATCNAIINEQKAKEAKTLALVASVGALLEASSIYNHATIAVSKDYVDALRKAYKELSGS